MLVIVESIRSSTSARITRTRISAQPRRQPRRAGRDGVAVACRGRRVLGHGEVSVSGRGVLDDPADQHAEPPVEPAGAGHELGRADGGDVREPVGGHVAQRGGERVLLVVGVDRALPGAVLDGGRGRDVQQQVHRPRRAVARRCRRPSSSARIAVHQAQVGRPARPGHQRRLGQARMLEQDGRVRREDRDEPLPPVAGGGDGAQVDLAEQFLEHRRVQFGGVADVDVERRRAGVELGRQPPHGDPVQPLRPHHRERGRDDAGPGQRGLRGPLAAASGGTGS